MRPWACAPGSLTSVTTALATLVVSAATIGWLLGALPQPAASARDTQDSKLVNRLTDDGPGKVVDNPTALSTEKAQAPERTQARPLLFGSPAVQQRAAEEEKPAAARTPQQVKEPTPEPATNQAAVQQVNGRDQEQAAKEAAERAAQDALKQWREAQEKLRQLARERSAKEAAEQAELEARQRVAKAAAAREAQRIQAEKEAPKRAVAAKADATRDVRQAPAKQAEDANRDCPTNPVTGVVVCQPKKPVARAPEPAARTSRMGSTEPTKAEPPRRAEPAANAASDQIWECLPRPPEGKVICHPIPNRP
jgi:hypothetical protein